MFYVCERQGSMEINRRCNSPAFSARILKNPTIKRAAEYAATIGKKGTIEETGKSLRGIGNIKIRIQSHYSKTNNGIKASLEYLKNGIQCKDVYIDRHALVPEELTLRIVEDLRNHGSDIFRTIFN